MPSSSIHQNYTEKNPLLPLTNDEECQRIECQRNISYRSKHRRQRLFIVLFIILFYLNAYREKLWTNFGCSYQDKDNISSAFSDDIGSSSIATYDSGDNQLSTATASCPGKPDIPFNGLSHFEFSSDEYPQLSISHKTNDVNRGVINYYDGSVNVILDDSISHMAVDFDLKFSSDQLNDVFWIEQLEDLENGQYSLVVRTDEDSTVEGCVIIDITVHLPSTDALKALYISLGNTAVIFDQGLKFDKLSIAVANGHIDIEKGITLAKTDFRLANGHVSGTIDSLSDELYTSIANGHFTVVVKEIDQITNNAISIKVETANGGVDLQVPASFESAFKLSTQVGRRTVTSDAAPQKVHRAGGGWGTTQGYFGDDANAKNKIDLSSATGQLKLNYV